MTLLDHQEDEEDAWESLLSASARTRPQSPLPSHPKHISRELPVCHGFRNYRHIFRLWQVITQSEVIDWNLSVSSCRV